MDDSRRRTLPSGLPCSPVSHQASRPAKRTNGPSVRPSVRPMNETVRSFFRSSVRSSVRPSLPSSGPEIEPRRFAIHNRLSTEGAIETANRRLTDRRTVCLSVCPSVRLSVTSAKASGHALQAAWHNSSDNFLAPVVSDRCFERARAKLDSRIGGGASRKQEPIPKDVNGKQMFVMRQLVSVRISERSSFRFL